ncbi:formyltransferase family protein [Algibacter sp. 2305UL17-15]|uniref:methionyl-tRNA formyltransferase n=1 Tax=Algibacter sp. 2305UL17-15 TaxID=3231268 RepID=UPI003457A890
MKTILIGSFPTCLSLFKHLTDTRQLTAVCFEASKNEAENEQFWMDSIQNEGYNSFVIDKNNIHNEFKDWLKKEAAELVLVCGFSLKIPKDILDIPKYGFLNIHFGKLPSNKGPNPIFWSIKNGHKTTAISIHKINEHWDSGPTVLEHPVSIIMGETAGMVNSKMSFMLGQLIQKAIDRINNQEVVNVQGSTIKNCYNKRPNAIDKSINWESHTVDEIENLVNACNPTYGGATTYYQGSIMKIVEVSPVADYMPLLGKISGEIIHAHPQEGLYVCCKYGKLLKLNIISSDVGTLTGTKYVHLGIQPGHRFTTTSENSNKESIKI